MPGTVLGLRRSRPSSPGAQAVPTAQMTPGPGGEGATILGQALWPVVSGLRVSQGAYVLAMTFSLGGPSHLPIKQRSVASLIKDTTWVFTGRGEELRGETFVAPWPQCEHIHAHYLQLQQAGGFGPTYQWQSSLRKAQVHS